MHNKTKIIELREQQMAMFKTLSKAFKNNLLELNRVILLATTSLQSKLEHEEAIAKTEDLNKSLNSAIEIHDAHKKHTYKLTSKVAELNLLYLDYSTESNINFKINKKLKYDVLKDEILKHCTDTNQKKIIEIYQQKVASQSFCDMLLKSQDLKNKSFDNAIKKLKKKDCELLIEYAKLNLQIKDLNKPKKHEPLNVRL